MSKYILGVVVLLSACNVFSQGYALPKLGETKISPHPTTDDGAPDKTFLGIYTTDTYPVTGCTITAATPLHVQEGELLFYSREKHEYVNGVRELLKKQALEAGMNAVVGYQPNHLLGITGNSNTAGRLFVIDTSAVAVRVRCPGAAKSKQPSQG